MMKLSRIAAAGLTAAALVALAPAVPTARGESDPAEFKSLKSKFEEAARKHDDDDNRRRANVILEFFDYLDQKNCRKLLLEAYADERMWIDCRVAVVQVLGACGDAKTLDKLQGLYKKEKALSPLIALGEGLSYTSPEQHEDAAAWILKRFSKAKQPELRLAMLSGLASLEQADAYDELLALSRKLAARELHEVYIGMGLMGGEKAVPELEKAMGHPDVRARLGATIGLARSTHASRLPILVQALGDLDPRVRETAAIALGAAAHEDAGSSLVDMIGMGGLREREVARTALRAITKKDYGHDGTRWRAAIAEKAVAPGVELPKIPKAFGIEVASDSVVIMLDISRSMNWNDRLVRARDGLSDYLKELPEDAMFNAYGVARDPRRFSESGMVEVATERDAGVTWLQEQLTGGWIDVRKTFATILDENPDVDTIVFATDSQPWGSRRAETPMEPLLVFRQGNRTRQIRVHVVMTVPGGRYTESENSVLEWDNRIENLTQLAEDSGGTFKLLED